jgi:hypothetical protein
MQELDEAVVLQMKPYKEFFDKEGFSPNLCFDIGANEGRYSRAMHYVFDVEIHSFEPVGETYNILTESISQDAYANIKTFNFGFSETEGTKTLVMPARRQPAAMPKYTLDQGRLNKLNLRVKNINKLNLRVKNIKKRFNSGLYSTHYKPEEGTSPVEAQFKNMEKWCREQDTYPDLIKLDVEGSELEVLRSIRGPILDGIRAIIIEVNYDEKFPHPSLINICLLENGFKAAIPELGKVTTIKQDGDGFYKKSYDRLWFKREDDYEN